MTIRKQSPFFLLILFGAALVLNLIWENAQAPLYEPYRSFVQHFPMCARASLWDAGYITVLYLGVALLNRDFFWARKRRASNYLIIVAISLIVAWWIEVDALRYGRWVYDGQMPLVFGVGLTPLVQLPLLSLAVYEFVRNNIFNSANVWVGEPPLSWLPVRAGVFGRRLPLTTGASILLPPRCWGVRARALDGLIGGRFAIIRHEESSLHFLNRS